MVSRKSHGFSRDSGGLWGILSSYGGDVHSKLEFVPGSQYNCLGKTDISGMSTRLGRTIGMLLEFKRESSLLF